LKKRRKHAEESSANSQDTDRRETQNNSKEITMKSNILFAAIVGLVFGALAELFFAFVDRIPLLGCLVTPVALAFGLILPMMIGALAMVFGTRFGTTILDGALAAMLAELVSRVFGFCASLTIARPFFFGPRFLLPSVEPATRALFTGVWSLGWLVVSLIVAGVLGAIGAMLYGSRRR
jgi:hypothetical protein